MAKVIISGDAIVVKSSMKLDDIRTIEKYRPNALVQMGGEDNKEKIFAIGTTSGRGSINSVGASFGRETYDEEKLACITISIDADVDGDIKEWVADHLGSAIINLNKIESGLHNVLASIEREKADVMSNITVAQ